MDYRIGKGDKDKIYHANMLKKYEVRGDSEPTDNSKTDIQGLMVQIAMGLITDQPIDHCVDGPDHPPMELIDFVPLKGEQTIHDVHLGPDLNDTQVRDVVKILKQFSKTLTDAPGRTTVGWHDIKLTSDEPVVSKSYSTPFASRDMVIKEVEDMLRLGVIERSDSPYASPIVLVKKKDCSISLYRLPQA